MILNKNRSFLLQVLLVDCVESGCDWGIQWWTLVIIDPIQWLGPGSDPIDPWVNPLAKVKSEAIKAQQETITGLDSK